MVQFKLIKVEAFESDPAISPRPPEHAVVHVEMKIAGIPKMELPIYISPLTTMDEALKLASERLKEIGQEIAAAADKPLLPLPRRKGTFDRS